jgi:hypothetical protein
MGDGTAPEDRTKWLANRVLDLEADLARLRMENHRLAELVRAADLVHIRLRAGLRQAIKWLDGAVPDAARAELRKLVTP